jgi:hypothetical protein
MCGIAGYHGGTIAPERAADDLRRRIGARRGREPDVLSFNGEADLHDAMKTRRLFFSTETARSTQPASSTGIS